MARALRFRFSRDERLKYIAHLDVLRLLSGLLSAPNCPYPIPRASIPARKLSLDFPSEWGLPVPLNMQTSNLMRI